MNVKAAAGIGGRDARRSFVRLIGYTMATGVLMVIGALAYLSFNTELNATIVIATVLGVFFSVLVGAGLMALGFLSSNSGHDDRVADNVHRDDRSE